MERANRGLPMAKGFVHLAAVLDWHTRRVLSWGLSITMETSFCIEAVKEALEKYGAPDIFNTDQGSQFSAQAFTRVLLDRNIAFSMDGRGAWRDTGIGNYFIFYNTKRPHQALDGNTPDAAYFTPQQLPAAA